MKYLTLRFFDLRFLLYSIFVFYFCIASTIIYAAEVIYNHTCVVQTDNTVICWGGRNKYGQIMPPIGTFLQVSNGGYHSCGIRTDKTVACWGLDEEGQATPPAGTFLQVSAGAWHTCGIKTDNTLICWGSNDPYWNKNDPYLNQWKSVKVTDQATPPKGEFLQVSAGGRHTCGLRMDHTITCWGSHSPSNSRSCLWCS